MNLANFQGVKRSWVFIFYCLLSVVIYGNALNGIFVHDDYGHIYANENIRDLKNIPRFFMDPGLLSSDPNFSGHYRPLTMTSHALSYAVGGLSPWAYKGMNLVFHVGSAFLLFLIIEEMLAGDKREGLSFFAALSAGLVFLAHPFNTEAINYVTARSSVVCAFFYLLAFWGWVRHRETIPAPHTLNLTPYYIASLFATILAMLTKEVAITFPAILWLYDGYFKGIWRREISLKWRTYLPYLPFALSVLLLYEGPRILFFHELIPPFKRDIMTQFYTGTVSLAQHIKMFFIPTGLSLFHDQEIYYTFFSTPVILSYFLLVIVVGAALWWGVNGTHPWRVVSFFTVWFFVVLSPTTIVPLNQIFQENRGYLAVIAFAALAAVVLRALIQKRWIVGISSLVLLSLAYSAITLYRNSDWKHPVTFMEREVRMNPLSFWAHDAMAYQYLTSKEYDKAILEAKRSLHLNPGYCRAYFTLGAAYTEEGEMDQAIEAFEEGLKIDDRFSLFHIRVARLYYAQGTFDRAEEHLQRAVQLRPDFYVPHVGLAEIHNHRGKFEDAIREYREALRLRPGHAGAQRGLAMMLKALGHPEQREGVLK